MERGVKKAAVSVDKECHGVLTQHYYPVLETLRDGRTGGDATEAFGATGLHRGVDRRRSAGGRILACGFFGCLEAGRLVFLDPKLQLPQIH